MFNPWKKINVFDLASTCHFYILIKHWVTRKKWVFSSCYRSENFLFSNLWRACEFLKMCHCSWDCHCLIWSAGNQKTWPESCCCGYPQDNWQRHSGTCHHTSYQMDFFSSCPFTICTFLLTFFDSFMCKCHYSFSFLTRSLWLLLLSGYWQVIWFWYCCRRSSACHKCCTCWSI